MSIETLVDRWFMCMAEAGFPKRRSDDTAFPSSLSAYRPPTTTTDELRVVVKAQLLSGIAALRGLTTEAEVLTDWASRNPLSADLADIVLAEMQWEAL